MIYWINKLLYKFKIYIYTVYSVSALSSFIEEGQRAKFFELTDNEISVFKVTLPDEEYKDLIEKCQYVNPLMNMDWSNFNGEEDYQKFKEETPESQPFKTKNATLSVEINGYIYILFFININNNNIYFHNCYTIL